MSDEKPDLLRQTEGFDRVHQSLTVTLIATRRDGDKDRSGVRVCRLDDSLSQVRASNVDPVFDFLPVEDTSGGIVGLYSGKNSLKTNDHGELHVRDCMCPLSEADLIGADATILDFIRRVRQKPLLVVSGGRIQGLVAWSDLQKLPVRAAVFGLVTGFELTMYEVIKRFCPEGDGWCEQLTPDRLKEAKKVFDQRGENDSDVELLLCTEFCDKRTILKRVLPFDPQTKNSGAIPLSKRQFEAKVKQIEKLRNDVAHASSYAMNWDAVESLKETVDALVKLRTQIKQMRPALRPGASTLA